MNLPRFTLHQLLTLKKLERPKASYFEDFPTQFRAHREMMNSIASAPQAYANKPTIWGQVVRFLDHLSLGQGSLRLGYATSFAGIVVLLAFIFGSQIYHEDASSAAALAWKNARNNTISPSQSMVIDYNHRAKTAEELRLEEEQKRKNAERAKTPSNTANTSTNFF